ncbi:MAG: cation:proton antiporter [Acidiferrobacteraceae bacterium]|nr:cation:proton antiporter [Acidiferrobacteraceae bacterium]
MISLLFILLVPLATALAVSRLTAWPNVREAISLLSGGFLFALVLSLIPSVLDGSQPSYTIAEPIAGLPIQLRAEPLGVIFSATASFLWLVTTLYSIGYMRSHGASNQSRFYAFFAVAITSTMGVAFSANLFTLFLFYELLTFSTYPLVTHTGTVAARKAGRTYLSILLTTSMAFFLVAIVWTWNLSGTGDFKIGGILEDNATPFTIGLLYALFVFGIGKAALMPFHRWLPAAMVAPTPVSALLHAVAVVKAGVFAILKITIYIFGLDLIGETGMSTWLLWVASATIVIASLIALQQDNLKRRLAYSTVSQLSYIVMGAILANSNAILGATMHITMHAVGKITLFFCAGAILVASHKTRVSEMDGLGRRMPFTMAAFFVGAISVAGLPPLGGFWGKWHLALGSLDAGYSILVAVLMVSTLLNIAYLIPIPLRAFFFKGPSQEYCGIKEAPVACLLAMGITAFCSLVLFFYPEPLYQLVIEIVN